MTEPAIPPRPRGPSSRAIIIATMILSALFGGVLGAAIATDAVSPDTLRQITGWSFLVVMVAACLVTIPYWSRLDEAAREAHKSAWLWGGGCAYVLAAILVAVALIADTDRFVPALLEETTRDLRAVDGILLAIALQSFGYAIGWLIWWRRRS